MFNKFEHQLLLLVGVLFASNIFGSPDPKAQSPASNIGISTRDLLELDRNHKLDVATPQRRGFKGFYILKQETQYFSVKIFETAGQVTNEHKPKFHSIHEKEIQIPIGEIEHYRAAEKAFELWGKKTSEAWQESVFLLERVLKNLNGESVLYEEFCQSYLLSLLETEEYNTFDEVIKAPLFDPYRSSLWFSEAVLSRFDAVESVDIYMRYKEVYEKFKDKNFSSVNQILTFAEVSISFSRSIFIEQFQGQNNVDFVTGENILERAVKICKKYEDSLCISHGLNARSIGQWLKGSIDLATKSLEASLRHARESEVPEQVASILNNIAFAHNWQSKEILALAALTEAYSIEEKLPNHSSSGTVALNIASVYFDLGRFELAKSYGLQAYSVFDEVDNHIGVMDAELFLGKLYLELEEYENAYTKLQSAFLRAEIVGENLKNKSMIISGYLAIASMVVGDQINGQKYFSISRSIFRLKNKNETLFDADALQLQKIYLEYAVETQQTGLVLELSRSLELFFQSSDSDQGFLQDKAEIDFLLAKNDLLNGRFSQCIKKAQQAIRIYDELSRDFDVEFSLINWGRKKAKVEALLIRALMLENKADTAENKAERIFRIISVSQGSSLLEARSLVRANISSAAESKNRAELKALAQLEAAVARTNEVSLRQKLILHIDNLRQNFLSSNLQRSNSKSSSLRKEISDIRDELSPGEVVLNYYIRKDVSYLLLIAKEAVDIVRLDSKQLIENEVSKIRHHLESRSSIEWLMSSPLGSMLGLENPMLKDKSKLIVLADGPVVSFPLEVVHVGGTSYRPIGIEKEVVYTLSVADYFRDELPTRRTGNDIYIFSDPVFKTEGDKIVAIHNNEPERFRDWSNGLRRLNWTALEAESIVAGYEGYSIKSVYGDEADSEALLSDEASKSKLLHIATHGYFSSHTPYLVGLATTPKGDDAGFVSLTRLYDRLYSSRLVVISACETTKGVVAAGEGAIGLAYGFLSRGAGSVMGTVWKIPDKPSALLMRKFYHYLKEENGNSSLALFRAKRDFARTGRYKHPFFWSSFILQSTSKSIEENVFAN